jgi:membrane associated rhomboid family serine protease
VYFFFFFPVGTDTRPLTRPVGTVLLLATMFALQTLRLVRPELHDSLILASFRPSDPSVAGALLSLFLHAGWIHLLGNALYLWVFGRQLEGRLGFLPLAMIFVVGGMLSCWAQAWLTPRDAWTWNVPLIGASGSVAAILGATIVRFRHRRVRILWLLFAFLGGMTRGGVAHLNTVLACLIWFVFQIVYLGVAWGSGGAGVAYAAHAGGFLAGAVLAVLLGLHRGPRREIHLDRGKRYFRRCDWYAAAGELTSHLAVVPEDTEARRIRARCLVLLGNPGEAAAEYLRLFRAARAARDVPGVASLYREMRRYGLGSNLPERTLLKLAFEFQKIGRLEEASEIYLEITLRFPEGEVTELAAIRRAELLWSSLGRYEEARTCYRQLLESSPEGEWRDLAEARLRSMSALTGETATGPATARGNRTDRGPSPARRATSA